MSKQKIKNLEIDRKTTEALSRSIEALKRGEVIVFPTETFYGLGADAFNTVAVERVLSLKGRSPDQPIPVIISDREMLKDVVTEIPPEAEKLIDRFWPGPLTLILPGQRELPAPLLNRGGGVGVRISSHSHATQLARDLGHPLTATSANPSAKEPARTTEEAKDYFSDTLKIFLEGGTLGGTKGSTVVEIVQGRLRIFREGEISSHELETALTSHI